MVFSAAGVKIYLRICIHTTPEHHLGGPEMSRQFKQCQRSILTCEVCWRQNHSQCNEAFKPSVFTKYDSQHSVYSIEVQHCAAHINLNH